MSRTTYKWVTKSGRQVVRILSNETFGNDTRLSIFKNEALLGDIGMVILLRRKAKCVSDHFASFVRFCKVFVARVYAIIEGDGTFCPVIASFRRPFDVPSLKLLRDVADRRSSTG